MCNRNIEILTVNFNTPDLVKKLLNSRIEFGYDIIPIHVIDGSDVLRFQEQVKKDCQGVKLTQFKYNIHHGPGLDFGITQSKKEYLFLMDSDSYFIKAGLFDELQFSKGCFGLGRIAIINQDGGIDKAGKIQYLHPNCCLINREKYLNGRPLIKHGAPFINTMIDMKFSIKDEWNVISKYVHFGSRGTRSLFGRGWK